MKASRPTGPGTDLLVGGEGDDDIDGGSRDRIEQGTVPGPVGLLAFFEEFASTYSLDGFFFVDPTTGDPGADDRPPRAWVQPYLDSITSSYDVMSR